MMRSRTSGICEGWEGRQHINTNAFSTIIDFALFTLRLYFCAVIGVTPESKAGSWQSSVLQKVGATFFLSFSQTERWIYCAT